MSYRIPRTLDNPPRCLGIPIDAFMAGMIVWTWLWLFDHPVLGVPLAIILAAIYGKYRTRSVTRKIVRLIYWYLPCEMNFITGIQGHQRKMNMRLTCRE